MSWWLWLCSRAWMKSGKMIPPVPFFFLKIALAIRGFLYFHTNCEIKLKMDWRSKHKTRNYKTPRGKHRQTLSDLNHSRILYDPPPRILEIKAKINKWDLIKIKSFCTTKETISKVKRQPSEWENNSKWSNWQTTNLKNVQATPVAQFQKNKWPNQKMGQRTKQTFFQRRHTDG